MHDAPISPRARTWRWWVAGLLLLATMLNYMDRQTLANLSVRITDEMGLSQEQYGTVETAFGLAFATGSLAFGILADRLPVRWLYPAVVVAWSAAGIVTAFAAGYAELLACRIVLGFYEAGHWPCALKTTRAVLDRGDRMLGNSILQSGGAIGAIVTPLVIRWLVGDDVSRGAWRPPFVITGAVGAAWTVGWLLSIRASDLVIRPDAHGQDSADGPSSAAVTVSASTWEVWREACLANRRFWALVPLIVSINITWHLLRVWLPKFLQQGRGVTEAEQLSFNSLYYVAADVGCIAAGAAGVWLVKRGMQVHRSRLVVLGVCAGFAMLTTLAGQLPRGPALAATLLVVGAAAMGLFPCYYSLAQEVSPRHLGRSTGLLAATGWLLSAPLQKAFGRLVDQTGSFDTGIALAGCVPAAAVLVLLAVWPRERGEPETTERGEPDSTQRSEPDDTARRGPESRRPRRP
jgi:sugar phosphate permease